VILLENQDTAGGWLLATLGILFLLGMWLGPGGGGKGGKGGKK
jgi:hypothetical protein